MGITKVPYFLAIVNVVLALWLMSIGERQEHAYRLAFEERGVIQVGATPYLAPAKQVAYGLSLPAILLVDSLMSNQPASIRDRSFMVCAAILWFVVGLVIRRGYRRFGLRRFALSLLCLILICFLGLFLALWFIPAVHYPVMFAGAAGWAASAFVVVISLSKNFLQRRRIINNQPMAPK